MSEAEDKPKDTFNEDVERALKAKADRLFQLKCKYGDVLGERIFREEQKEVEESVQE